MRHEEAGAFAATTPTQVQKSALLPIAAGALAIGIFVFDTMSPLQFAVAVLYVVVILIVATHYQRLGVLITAGVCALLTVVSYLLVHRFAVSGTAPIRGIMSLAAIGITTSLALRNLSANERLRQTERQRANLARFFSPRLVDQLVEIDIPLSVARHRPAAVMFVDMIGFTTYCSRMPPDAVIALLRDFLALLSTSVFSHNGAIDKFLGDGLMAVFGPPAPTSSDVTNAARCALDILKSIDRWNERCNRSGDAAIRVAIGIHYGDVIQGDIGSEKQLEFTVVGDNVNIASRVEAYCRPLEAAVLITGAVNDALYAEGSDILAETFQDEGRHVLRGHSEPVHLYSVRRPNTGLIRVEYNALTYADGKRGIS
jgi:adenylate cyclase